MESGRCMRLAVKLFLGLLLTSTGALGDASPCGTVAPVAPASPCGTVAPAPPPVAAITTTKDPNGLFFFGQPTVFSNLTRPPRRTTTPFPGFATVTYTPQAGKPEKGKIIAGILGGTAAAAALALGGVALHASAVNKNMPPPAAPPAAAPVAPANKTAAPTPPSAPMVTTSLCGAAMENATTIFLCDISDLSVGMSLVILGGNQSQRKLRLLSESQTEEGTIIAFSNVTGVAGNVTIDKPLKFNHINGTTVTGLINPSTTQPQIDARVGGEPEISARVEGEEATTKAGATKTTQDKGSSAWSSGDGWWIWLILGLLLCCLVAAALGGFFMMRGKKKKSSRKVTPAVEKMPADLVPNATDTVPLMSPTVVEAGPLMDSRVKLQPPPQTYVTTPVPLPPVQPPIVETVVAAPTYTYAPTTPVVAAPTVAPIVETVMAAPAAGGSYQLPATVAPIVETVMAAPTAGGSYQLPATVAAPTITTAGFGGYTAPTLGVTTSAAGLAGGYSLPAPTLGVTTSAVGGGYTTGLGAGYSTSAIPGAVSTYGGAPAVL